MKKIFFLLLLSPSLFSQDDLYDKADSIALNFPKNKYYFYQETAQELTENLKTEKEKCRAIFRWITNNIKYNHDELFDYKADDALAVYKKKKAVCAGYASLFKAMCEEAKIECHTVIGQAGCADNCWHAWSVVKLDGEYYAMDVTWASGYLGTVKNKFTKSYDETYWMADPQIIKKNHWSSDWYWQNEIINKGKTTND